jgi:uncharacterized protein YajQ (UPF0234 family)
MPSFDLSSELDAQEVRNAVDQAQREVANRYDFKGTDSLIELGESTITLESSADDRATALKQVLEEKLVKRKVSLKGVDFGDLTPAAGGRSRLVATLAAGISSDKARELNKFIKGLALKGIQSQTQGDELRVIGKKRDDLQAVIAALKAEDFGIPLQFGNFRD